MRGLRLPALAATAALALTSASGVPPWVPWGGGQAFGVLRQSSEVGHWRIVYDPGKSIVVDSSLGGGGTFAPELKLVNGAGQVVDASTAPPGATSTALFMAPGGTVTNVLDVYVAAASGSSGPFPAVYGIWKQ